MSQRESGQRRRRGPNQGMFFDQEWHPDQCSCTQCQQEEQQVLSQFENDMNRLEVEVQKSNEFTSTTPRHIETEWSADGRALPGASGKSAKPPEGPPTPQDPHHTSRSRTESKEEERDSENTENTQWTGPQERNGEVATHAGDDDVGMSFVREMYQHFDVRYAVHEQWPPEHVWRDECQEQCHYPNGTIHQQLNGNNHHHASSDNCKELNSMNNNNNHNHHHSLSKGGSEDDPPFTTANQERYNQSISAKKSKRKLNLGLKDTIKRRYIKTPTPTDLWLP